MQRMIFSKNRWTTVTIPRGYDPAWTDSDLWYFATAWVAADGKGFAAKRCEQIAEAVVSKRLYPGLTFGKELERDIAALS
jgi:hypothetical protein